MIPDKIYISDEWIDDMTFALQRKTNKDDIEYIRSDLVKEARMKLAYKLLKKTFEDFKKQFTDKLNKINKEK